MPRSAEKAHRADFPMIRRLSAMDKNPKDTSRRLVEASLWAAVFQAAEEAGDRTLAFRHRASFRRFAIPKAGSSKKRVIQEPDKTTMALARALDKALWKTWTPKFESGFKPDSGQLVVLDQLRLEMAEGSAEIISLDLKRAFEAVSAKQIYAAFKKRGFSRAISRLVIRLTTQNGRLVMGSPLSPQVFAIVIEETLNEVEGLNWVKGITAYADDIYVLAIPGEVPTNWKRIIKTILWTRAFQRLNASKTNRPRSELLALGAKIDKQGRVVGLRPHIDSKIRACQLRIAKGGKWTTRKGLIDPEPVLDSLSRYRTLLLETDRIADSEDFLTSLFGKTRRAHIVSTVIL